MKKSIFLLIVFVIFSTFLAGCDSETSNADIPTLKVGYIFTNHQTPLMVAASKGEDLKEEGVYLKEVTSRERYVLMEEDNPLANIELIVTSNGSEAMTMMSQGHIDIGLASGAAFLSSLDQGANIKMLCPVHTEGIGLVMDKDAKEEDWDDFEKLAMKSEEPIKVGFHSPTSAPLILFESALTEVGLSYTKDPDELNADILLVDLRGTSNFLSALTSGQVDAWVGPSPWPELAVTEGVGKIILDMREMSPYGQWFEFPCCVAGATEKSLDENKKEVEAFLQVLTAGANYANEHSQEAAEITSEFTGVSVEAAKMSSIKYTTEPTDQWINNFEIIYNTLQNTGSFDNDFAHKSFEDIFDIIFDIDPIANVLE
ncbi:ABC transporter substrate-binding protein [Proteinivorax tanatarense]|uniref:ABC transporter substrate-binding protein n=1 Tax=Proteinivorax tanatarense TaxID=1260629 RepID=A0AAU7VN61_9FIRM